MENQVQTEKRLATMEQKIDNLIEDVRDIAKDIKCLDGKYSGKWVEKTVIAIGTAVASAIIIALIKFL